MAPVAVIHRQAASVAHCDRPKHLQNGISGGLLDVKTSTIVRKMGFFFLRPSVALEAVVSRNLAQALEITSHPWWPNCRWRKLAVCDFVALGGFQANYLRV